MDRAQVEALEKRVRDAADAAEEAFWEKFVESFPEVQSGDVDPGFVDDRRSVNRQFAFAYLWANAPSLPFHLDAYGHVTIGERDSDGE